MRFKFAKNSFSKMFQIETNSFVAAIQSSEINIINDDAQLIYNDEIIIINTECPYDISFDYKYDVTDRGFVFTSDEVNSFDEAVEKFREFLEQLEETDAEVTVYGGAQ